MSSSWTYEALKRRRDAALRLPPLWCETCKVSFHDPDLHECRPRPQRGRHSDLPCPGLLDDGGHHVYCCGDPWIPYNATGTDG